MINKKQGAGFTLIELMLAVAIAGLLASLAVPSFSKMLERNRLKEAVEGLKSDLMWMRTETIKRSCYFDSDGDGDDDGGMRVDFDTGTWSYTIYRVAGVCGCPAGSNCNDKVVSGSDFTGIDMSATTFGGNTTRFDFRRGKALIAGNVQLDSTNYHVKVVVAPVGRIRICNISGQTGLLGYEDC